LLSFHQSHRIGQTKPVTVYKLVAKDTVDSDIYKMQEKKTKMNAAIMESHSHGGSGGTSSLDKKTKKELTEASIHRFMTKSSMREEANTKREHQLLVEDDDTMFI
jgi:SNF2 family DNA or RNA helicase